ncbi:MAG: metal ABC transporter permease, partial [bacterium]
DIKITGLIVLITLFAAPLWRRWAYATFDRELAETDHLSVQKDDYLLSLLIAVTIVVAIKVVGIVLIAAFLVIPAATARILSRSFRKMTTLSIIIGVLSALIGLLISYYLDVPSGATIILFQAVLFFVTMLFKSVRKI